MKVWTEVCAYLGKTLEAGAAQTLVEQYYRDKILGGAADTIGDSVPVFRARRKKVTFTNAGEKKDGQPSLWAQSSHLLQQLHQLQKQVAEC